jgi:hypothetical protein
MKQRKTEPEAKKQSKIFAQKQNVAIFAPAKRQEAPSG